MRRGLLIAGAIAVLLGLAWITFVGDSFAPHSHGPTVRSNMYDVQLAVEDFAVQRADGRYPNTSEELAPCVRERRLRNSITKLPLDVTVRQGPRAQQDTACAPGSIVVERPDSASYVICGCNPSGRWLDLQVRNEPVTPEPS